MKSFKINCPRCNSPQKFGKQKREVSPGEYEIYIQCKQCRWLKVIMRGDTDKIHNARQIEKLKIRSKNSPELQSVLQRKIDRNG
jgi:hypothetical protein